MSNRDSDAQLVCLNFGLAQVTLIEGDEDLLIEDLDDISEFRFSGTDSMDLNALYDWVKNKINVDFGGDLDDPDKFSSITAVGIYGPRFAEYGDIGLALSGLSVYLEVKTTGDDLDGDMIDDLFHLVILEVRDGNTYAMYRLFSGYSGEIEENLPLDIRVISVEWNGRTNGES